MMTDEIFDIDGAAKFLGIKKRTMYKLVSEGDIPATKIGGQWRFSRTQLLKMFQTNSPMDNGDDSHNLNRQEN